MEEKRNQKRRYSKEEALEAMQRYCIYQDRCHQEVRYKLIAHQVYGDDLEDVISDLIADNFLNEERFAMSYARGKHKIKSWGKYKIKVELKRRGISDYCIKKALGAIDQEDYYNALLRVLEKRWDGQSTDFKSKKKLIDYAISRGYEYEIIKMTLEDLFLNQSN